MHAHHIPYFDPNYRTTTGWKCAPPQPTARPTEEEEETQIPTPTPTTRRGDHTPKKVKDKPNQHFFFFFCCTSHPPDPIYIPFGFDLFLKHRTIKIGFGFTGSPGIGGKFATLFISLRLGWRGGGRGFIKRKSEILFIVERRAMFRWAPDWRQI